jgi:hypothetical protein
MGCATARGVAELGFRTRVESSASGILQRANQVGEKGERTGRSHDGGHSAIAAFAPCAGALPAQRCLLMTLGVVAGVADEARSIAGLASKKPNGLRVNPAYSTECRTSTG